MADSRQFLIAHGAPILFGAVLVEQLGLPIPALPWLLAAGALAAAGKLNPATAAGLTLLACLMGDGLWFFLGRFRGNQVLGLLCRISLEPDSCVRRTQGVFTRYGWKGIMMAKFVPGLSTVAPPLAGMAGLGAPRFFLIDGAGSLLYAATFLGLGYVFSNQIERIEEAIASVGASAFCLLVGAAAAYLGFKYWQRRRLLGELRMTRINVRDLRGLLEAGEDLTILDLRSLEELAHDPARIQGAIHLTLDDVKAGRYEIPRDRDVIVYCSCPNEITSARVALLLRRNGFTRVRPLLGGIDAWRAENYPLEAAAAAPKL
ncbi:MAG TPA: DedA family protein/thiosulfate sulfurtransferase GlpE [Verrucomicrobiae bacterium]|jgi:membrane protein DedA with SNARE-associated domain/rhodanese-related sulfurtransferase|nr:DedA family protein/thiosulfate sulfurtransferase GlpE [Verrucomicrobiae bacterium]